MMMTGMKSAGSAFHPPASISLYDAFLCTL